MDSFPSGGGKIKSHTPASVVSAFDAKTVFTKELPFFDDKSPGPGNHGRSTAVVKFFPAHVPAKTPRKEHETPVIEGGFFRNLSKRYSRFQNDLQRPRSRVQSAPSSGPREGKVSSDTESENALHEKMNLRFLERLWGRIKDSPSFVGGINSFISYSEFLKICKKELDYWTPRDEELLSLLYKLVDRKSTKRIKSVDITTAMVLICTKASQLDKLRFLFRIFGTNDDSSVTPDEIFDLYFTIKLNDLTKDPCRARADLMFNDELSLQDAKRIYELTVPLMMSVGDAGPESGVDDPSDFIFLEEFLKVFEDRPYLLEILFPGSFSFHWVLHNLADANVAGQGGGFHEEVVSHFVKILRKGDEHLNLSVRRGRGRRIVHSAETNQVKDVLEDSKPPDPKKRQDQCAPSGFLGKKGKGAKVTSSKREGSRHESGFSDSSSSSSDDERPSVIQKRTTTKKAERTAYEVEDVKLPDIPWLSLMSLHQKKNLSRVGFGP